MAPTRASRSSTASPAWCWSRNSRHSFQQTHSSRIPPARQQADDLQQERDGECEDDAQDRRGGDADDDDLRALIARQAGGGHADDDGVVARQNEVNPDDTEKGAPEMEVEVRHAGQPEE